jgi:solute carrier family 25 (mitochondrial folate transporter), member 32
MFTAPPNSPAAHRGLWSAFLAYYLLLLLCWPQIYHRNKLSGGTRAIYRDEGLRGLYRGTTLALVGVGNGALQFMAYEKMKGWAYERRRRRLNKLGRAWTMEDDKLVRTAHIPPLKKRKLTYH